MRFRHPDEVVRRYLRTRARAMAPRGMQVAQRGRSYAAQCAERRCAGRGKRIGQRDGQGDTVQRCSNCGAPWPFSDVFALAGQSLAGRGGRPPQPMLEAGDLCLFTHRLLTAKSLEPGHGAVFLRYLEEGVSRRALAERLTAERFGGRDWHPRDVRRAVERSEALLARDLGRRGMLER